MLQLTFKQTNAEMLVRAAATILFNVLKRRNATEVTIADLAERSQYGFTAGAVSEQVGPKFVRITDLQDGRIHWPSVPYCECPDPEKYALQENDILFARTGATTGKTYLVRAPQQAVFASYLIRLRPKPDVDAGYLYGFFQSDTYWSQILEEKEGSAQPNVNGEKLAALSIPYVASDVQHSIANFLHCVRRRQDGELIELPELLSPLAEQRRVVGRIEALACQIHEVRSLRRKATEEVDALITSARSKLIEDARRFGDRPFDSTITQLRGVSGLAQTDYQQGGKYPVIDQGRQFIAGYCDDDSRLLRLPGTVVVWGDHTTNVKLVDFDFVPGADGTKVFLPREEILPTFLAHFLKTVRYPDLGYSRHYRHLKTERVPVPPVPEQRRVVAVLDALQADIDALKRFQSETAVELDALLPSILNCAFKRTL